MRFRRRRARPQVSIFASGSEVSLAVAAQALLKEKGIAARVVSVPCMDAFFDQPEDYRRSVIGSAKVKVAVEAAVRFGWDAIIGDGPFIGMTGFGESGPYKAVYRVLRHHARSGGRGRRQAARRVGATTPVAVASANCRIGRLAG